MGSVTAQWEPQRDTPRPTIGVEPFDTGYGGGFEVQVDSPEAMACELVEDGGRFVAICQPGRSARGGWRSSTAR